MIQKYQNNIILHKYKIRMDNTILVPIQGQLITI